MPCNDYQPDHNGECLNCDESADGHTFPIGPHAKLAADCWKMICAITPELDADPLADARLDAAAQYLIELACDSAAETAVKNAPKP